MDVVVLLKNLHELMALLDCTSCGLTIPNIREAAQKSQPDGRITQCRIRLEDGDHT